MFKSTNTTAAGRLGTALILCSSLLLAGCESLNSAIDDMPASQAHYDRYPIEVRKKPGTNRAVAVTKECGDWSDNLAVTSSNTPYLNHGCAHQNNLAAIVANPADFVKPRTMTRAPAANRTDAMTLYNTSPERAFNPSDILSD